MNFGDAMDKVLCDGNACSSANDHKRQGQRNAFNRAVLSFKTTDQSGVEQINKCIKSINKV